MAATTGSSITDGRLDVDAVGKRMYYHCHSPEMCTESPGDCSEEVNP